MATDWFGELGSTRPLVHCKLDDGVIYGVSSLLADSRVPPPAFLCAGARARPLHHL